MQHCLAEPSAGIDLSSLWQELCHGQLFIQKTYCSAGRCFAVIERRARERKPYAGRHLDTLERILLGESQKVVASELGVSAATIAGYTTAVMSRMVTGHLVSRAPIVLVLAVFAARGFAVQPARYEAGNQDGSWVLSVAVPGETFRDRLSAGEWEIARLSIEGMTHLDMALVRGTSTRTVANQLGATFSKLRVSGRAELRAKAVRELGQHRATVAPFIASAPLGDTSPLRPAPDPARRHLHLAGRIEMTPAREFPQLELRRAAP